MNRQMLEQTLGQKELPRCCVDSRQLLKGDLFFALKGERADGHAFIEEVARRGAVGAVVSRQYHGEIPDFLLFRVDDPLQCLQALAREKLACFNPKVVAITGSIGKTTTKCFLQTLLEDKFKIAVSPGNSNSQIGLPLSLLNHMDGTEEIVVLEMGMTAPGEIAKLVQIAPPSIALITSIDRVHIGYFESLKEIAKAKGEIFSHPKTALGLFPEGVRHSEELLKIGKCPKKPFTDQLDIELPVLGHHNLHNFSAAAAVARALGMTSNEIIERIPYLSLPERRLERVVKGGITFINDSYNACVTSMKGALSSLPEPEKGGKKIAVLGAMVELGELSEEAHREVGEYALERVERLFCLHDSCQPMVDCWQHAKRPVSLYQNRETLTAALKQNVNPGDVVLLKGSNLRQLWKVLEAF